MCRCAEVMMLLNYYEHIPPNLAANSIRRNEELPNGRFRKRKR